MIPAKSKHEMLGLKAQRRRAVPGRLFKKDALSKLLERTTILVDVGAIVRAIGYATALIIAAQNTPNAMVEAVKAALSAKTDSTATSSPK